MKSVKNFNTTQKEPTFKKIISRLQNVKIKSTGIDALI